MEQNKRPDFVALTLSAKDFIRALSHRDIFTSFSLVLLLLAVRELIDYYSLDDWINSRANFLLGVCTTVVLAGNHVFYKLEHKRSNNFIGRVCHDAIFLVLFFVTSMLKGVIAGNTFSFDSDSVGNILFTAIGLLIFLIFYELLIALFKRCLKLFRWQIL